MTATCESCGDPYERKTGNQKFCTTKCRVRNHQTKAKSQDSADKDLPDLVDVVRRDLVAAGVLDTAAGVQALRLAKRMVTPTADTGSSYAAVSRELSRALEEAKAVPSSRMVNPVDEFTARRQARRGAA